MMYLFQFLLLIKFTTIFVICENYCDPDLCKTDKHIGCDNNGEIDLECASFSNVLDISNIRDDILDWHNEKRNMVAAGLLPGFEPAVKMGTMMWDTELEYLASLNVKTCNFGHDDCRNTIRFKHSGQNIAYWSGNYDKDIKIAFSEAIDDWFEEYKDASTDDINSYTSGRSVGHFTVIVNEKNIYVGCAVLEKDIESKTKYHITCNYAFNNIIDCPVYESGASASKCTKTNQKYLSLCDEFEDIDLNDTC